MTWASGFTLSRRRQQPRQPPPPRRTVTAGPIPGSHGELLQYGRTTPPNRGVTVPVLMTAAALVSSPPPLPGFLNALASPLQHYGLWAIFLLIMLEDFGIPVPGETILIAGAIYAGAGRLNIVTVGVVGFIAAIIGDNIGFAIGHFGGRALALRWGKYVFLTEERLDKAQGFFDRRGAIVITFARFVEGLRQANGIIAGISGMHWLRFLAFNALGAALWVGTWVSLGYLAGDHIATIYHYITQYSYYVLIAGAVLLVAYIAWRMLRRHRATAAASPASGADETHDCRDTSEATGIAPGEPARGAHASPGHEAEEHPPAGHQHGETTPGGQAAPGHGRDDHAPDTS
jgi:membrane protein DedA with SNARE-associated domain